MFAAALGVTATGAAKLRHKLLEAAKTSQARFGERDSFGQRYTLDFSITTAAGQAIVRSGWIVLRGRTEPRLTICYVKQRKR